MKRIVSLALSAILVCASINSVGAYYVELDHPDNDIHTPGCGGADASHR